MGFAEAGCLSHSPFGCKAPLTGGRGPGGDRGTCVAGLRARAQLASTPPGPGPTRPDPTGSDPIRSHSIRSPSPPGLTHCPAVVRHTRHPKLRSLLRPGLAFALEMFGLFPPKQPIFKTWTLGLAPGPLSLYQDSSSLLPTSSSDSWYPLCWRLLIFLPN